jgi:Zn-dependent protease
MWQTFLDISAWVIPVVLAVTLHEVSHGYVAEKLGDDTARRMGRITLNPLKHIDAFGTIIFPALLVAINSPAVFGSAKPVPVNFNQLHPLRLGMALVAIAGPITNILLALISGLLLHLDKLVSPEQAPWLFENLYRSLMINCVLASFNMLPLLPLDGGRVVAAALTGAPKRLWMRTERFGLAILLFVLIIPAYMGYDVVQSVLLAPAFGLLQGIMWITGNGG